MQTNQINETLIDKRIRQAIDYGKGSDTSLKCAALAAGRVVGKYTAATQQIADARNREVSTVQNWAHAAWMYQELKDYPRRDVQRVRELWHELPVSHWWLAWDKIRNCNEAHNWNTFYYLNNAFIHGWSGRRMLEEFQADYVAYEGAPPPVKITTVYNKAVSVVTDVLTRLDEITDDRIIEWARQGMNLFAELGLVKEQE